MSSSLSRAFTTRRVKINIDLKETKEFLTRSSSTKTNSILRPKISGPVQLVHTTNMLSYNAPDIDNNPKATATATATSTAKAARRTPSSSHSSDNDSLNSPSSSASSMPTSPEASICERPTTPEMFETPGPKSPRRQRTSASDLPPSIPHRAPSHTKKASMEAMRHRSGSITASPTSTLPPSPGRSVVSKSSMTFSSRASTTSTSTSATSHSSFHALKSPPLPQQPPMRSGSGTYDLHRGVAGEASPFGQELAQVAEIAEQFGVKHRLEVIDEEERELNARGLYKYTPDVYLREVQGVRLCFFPETTVPFGGVRPAPVWI